MAENITLGTVSTFTNDSSAVSIVNNNSQLITNALANTLDRYGSAPNGMQAVLDMNNFNIINLPSPATINSPARLVDVVSNPTIQVPTVGTSGATVPLLNGVNTWSGVQTFTNSTPSSSAGAINIQFNQNASSNILPQGIWEFQVTAGNCTAPLGFNTLTIFDSVIGTTNFINGWSFTHDINGGAGGRVSMQINCLLSNSSTWQANAGNSFVTGLIVNTEVSVNVGGSSGSRFGQFFAFNPVATLASGATFVTELCNTEADVGALSGSSVDYISGLKISQTTGAIVHANLLEAALAFTGGSSIGGWNNIILLGAFAGGAVPTNSSTRIFGCSGMSSSTIATGFDLTGIGTITGNSFAAPNFFVTGTGGLAAVTVTASTGLISPVLVNQGSGLQIGTTTDTLKFAGSGMWTATGAGTVGAIGNVGPTNITLKEWFTMTDPGGNIRYVPAFGV